MVEEEIRLYASHHQFYVQDSEPLGSSDSPDFWTRQACEDQLAVGDGLLGIGTGSYDFVRVRVQEHQAEPALQLSEWDHVVEAGLEVRTRYLLVMGCLSSSGLFFRVQPGHYRVRCCQANLAASEDSTGDAGDWYLVQFWPAEPSGARVLKRWTVMAEPNAAADRRGIR
jgi:hypothetical protein